MTAAASARRSSDVPPPEMAVNDWKPVSGTRRMIPIADSRPAAAHTSVDSRVTGMPSNLARSPLSAAARNATP